MVFVDSTSFANAPYQLIEYFAKACPHCVHMAPVWGLAKSAAINASDAGTVDWVQKECYGDNWAPGPDLNFCKSKGIDSFPTIVLEKTGTSEHWMAPPLTGANDAQKAEQLNQFVNSHTANSVKESGIGVATLLSSHIPIGCTALRRYKSFI